MYLPISLIHYLRFDNFFQKEAIINFQLIFNQVYLGLITSLMVSIGNNNNNSNHSLDLLPSAMYESAERLFYEPVYLTYSSQSL